MSKKPTTNSQPSWTEVVPRRAALRGMGALALSLPTLSALGCGREDDPVADTNGDEAADDQGAGRTRDGGQGSAQPAHDDAGSPLDAGGSAQPPRDSGSLAETDSEVMPRDAAGADPRTASDAGASAAPPAFEDATSCTLTAVDIEGPFYIDDAEVPDDIGMVRSDVRDGHPGVPFRLSFRFLDAKGQCGPIEGAEAYIWHCDADGYYSGFDGQNPRKPYTGSANPKPSPAKLERFCRGIQVSGSDGIVTFTSIYPGWYTGRPVHVHLLARLKGPTKALITTQLYFPAEVSKNIYETEPAYLARGKDVPQASLDPPRSGRVGPTLSSIEHRPGLVVAALNVIVNRT